MAQKRPISDEVVYESTSKHQRQNRSSDEITLCNDSFSIEGVSEKPYASGMGFVGEANLGKGDVTRSALLSHWASNISTSDEDEPPEDLFHPPSSPGYYSFDYSARPAIYSDDLHNCLLDYPPRKHVPIGPDHQAEIPRWGPLENKNVPDVGISILLSSETGEEVGYGRTVCNCPDKGSIRCVRQHVSEARDRLRRTFGQATFAELGFNDMGEVVAEKWSAEEEELFDDIIYSNPASTGKDFWKALSAVFPTRTKMEIVSYYFNVNMLRKRAEQNRVDPLNIDSDNDEWQGSDNEESTVQDGLDDNSPQKQEYETDSDPAFDLHGKKSDERENGIQDGGSSTSSDSGAQGGSCLSKSDGCLEWNRYNALDSYDTKLLWENTSSSSPEIDLDFLPTCSMIEEIFGEGSFDSKGW